jgi:acylaminoacyl-peptidase
VTSDITDWVFGQLNLGFDQLEQRMYTAEEMQLLRDRSPSAYASQVRCRTLLLLGALDLRVPPSQGLLWANLLRSNHVPCTTYMYPDANHGLETPNSELFGLIAILEFLAG